MSDEKKKCDCGNPDCPGDGGQQLDFAEAVHRLIGDSLGTQGKAPYIVMDFWNQEKTFHKKLLITAIVLEERKVGEEGDDLGFGNINPYGAVGKREPDA